MQRHNYTIAILLRTQKRLAAALTHHNGYDECGTILYTCKFYLFSFGNDGIPPGRSVHSTGGAADQQATRVMAGFVSFGAYWKRVVAKRDSQKSAFAERGQQERYVVIVIKAAGCLVESMERGPSRT
jgi:hypothetical protein